MSPGHEGKEEKLVMWLSNSFGHHSIFFSSLCAVAYLYYNY